MKNLNDKTYNWLMFNTVKIINIIYVIIAIALNIYMYHFYKELYKNQELVFLTSIGTLWVCGTIWVFINILLLPLDKWDIVQKLRGRVTLAETEEYTLYYYPGAKLYHAGCRILKAKEACEHWFRVLLKPNHNVNNERRERAKLFLAAINQNEESLK